MKTLILSVIRCFLMFSAAAALFLAHPASANLVSNPGFETGDFTGWGYGFGAVDNSNPHSGLYAALERGGDALFQTIHTVPGATYDLSLWVATARGPDSLSDNELFFNWNGSLIDRVFLIDEHPYFQLTYTDLVATGLETTIVFSFESVFFGGLPVYLDDVSVTESGVGVGEPFSTLWFALPVAGMIVFGLFRPKRV
jgi:hypothetical protein